jgi:hypothetical protein
MVSKRAGGVGGLSLVVLAGALGLAGCTPATFVQTGEASAWSKVDIEGITYDEAWNRCVDVVARKFDLDAPLSKESGYLRTCWMYNWTGGFTPDYRVRVSLKFAPDRKSVDVKTEAEYGGAAGWIPGSDTRLLETVKADIMGVVARTTR